jgi:hypothetical protein
VNVAIELLPLKATSGRENGSHLCRRDDALTVTFMRDGKELGSAISTNHGATIWTVSKSNGSQYEWYGKLRVSGSQDETLEWSPASDEVRRAPLTEPQFVPKGFTIEDVHTNRDLIDRRLYERSINSHHIKEWEIIAIDSEHGRAILRQVTESRLSLAPKEIQFPTMALLSPVEVTIYGVAKVYYHLRNDRGGALFEVDETDGRFTGKPVAELRALPIDLVRKSVGMSSIETALGNSASKRIDLSQGERNKLQAEVSARFGDTEKFKEPCVGTDAKTAESIFFCASRDKSYANKTIKNINCEDELHDSPDWQVLTLVVDGKSIIRYRPTNDSDKHKGTFFALAEDQDGNPILRRDYSVFTHAAFSATTDDELQESTADASDYAAVSDSRMTSFAPELLAAPLMPETAHAMLKLRAAVDQAITPATNELSSAKISTVLRMFDNDQSFVEFLCKRIERTLGEPKDIARREMREYASMTTNDRSWTRTEVVTAAMELLNCKVQLSVLDTKTVTINQIQVQVGTLAIELLQHCQDATFFAPPPVTAPLTRRPLPVAAVHQVPFAIQ